MTGRCPICGKSYKLDTLTSLPTFPFCSERCRLVDLGRWIDGAYVIPGPDPSKPTGDEPDPNPEEPESEE
ncbi:MAG: DNA gyrase inhibitor YacG [Isosphaeraceae bacterium]